MRKMENVLYGISVFLLIWVLASWVDVIAHNLTTCTYQVWNFFPIFVKFYEFIA